MSLLERKADGRDLSTLVEEYFRTSFETANELITEAVRRMLDAGGKRLRPRFTLLAAEAVGGRAEDHLRLAAFMELIHVATLIHDDVVDHADTRRVVCVRVGRVIERQGGADGDGRVGLRVKRRAGQQQHRDDDENRPYHAAVTTRSAGP